MLKYLRLSRRDVGVEFRVSERVDRWAEYKHNALSHVQQHPNNLSATIFQKHHFSLPETDRTRCGHKHRQDVFQLAKLVSAPLSLSLRLSLSFTSQTFS